MVVEGNIGLTSESNMQSEFYFIKILSFERIVRRMERSVNIIIPLGLGVIT